MKTDVKVRTSKSEIYWKTLSAVLKLEVEKGHLQWKLTDLARISGVQRTLIYYYFGSNRESLVEEALELVARDLFGIPRGIMNTDLLTSITEAREMIEKAPQILQFYLRWRSTSSPMGDRLRAYEKAYKKRLEMTFPHLKTEERDSIFALFFGLVSLPDISKKAIRAATRSLVRVLPQNSMAPASFLF